MTFRRARPCPICGKPVALSKDGRIRWHRDTRERPGGGPVNPACAGVSRLPDQQSRTPVTPDPSPDNPTAQATTYTITCLPDTIPDRSSWNITVEWRGPDTWAVKRWSDCLGRDGIWEYEPNPSSRTDEWIAGHRFPLAEALELAKRAAPDVIVNGFTPADLLEWHAAGCPRPIPRPKRMYITEAGTK